MNDSLFSPFPPLPVTRTFHSPSLILRSSWTANSAPLLLARIKQLNDPQAYTPDNMRLLSLLSLFLFAVLAALAQARDTSSLSYHAARSAALAAPALPVERSAIQFRREVDENGSDSVLFDRGLGKAVYPINKALHPGDYKSPYHPGKNVPEEPKGESRQFMAGKK